MVEWDDCYWGLRTPEDAACDTQGRPRCVVVDGPAEDEERSVLGGEEARGNTVVRAHCRQGLDVGVRVFCAGHGAAKSFPPCISPQAILL